MTGPSVKPVLVSRWIALPDYVIGRLEHQAAALGRSFSGHVRELLGAATKPDGVSEPVR